MKRAAVVPVVLAVLLCQGIVPAAAQTRGSLSFFKNYFVTGDYVVGGTSLWRQGVNGTAAGSIVVSGVPDEVDILAAYLYFQTTEVVQWSGIDHAKFNGNDLGPGAASLAKALNWDLATSPCWSIAWPGGRKLVTYRADVLRFLPIDATTGKQAVKGPHTIEVPDYGALFDDDDEVGRESGSQTGPRAVGASLVVVYRDPAKALRAIVIYDGGVTKRAFATLNQSLQGFYEAAAIPAARMTHIVGDGRPYLSESVRLNDELIATNPFRSSAGPKWDNPTFEGLPVPSGAASAALQVGPNGLFSDCLSYSGIVFSTAVQDTDGDGLLDSWERQTSTNRSTLLVDPNGMPLPALGDLGATPDAKDLFVEIGYMSSGGDTGHTHLPGHAALKLVGDAFKNAPDEPINVHFDVGPDYPAGDADEYIVPRTLARGGEAIDEQVTVCTRGAADPPWVCQFSEFPGTVGWKTGFKFLQDQVISGPAVEPGQDDPCDVTGNTCVRRFDRNRKDMFRFALFAHAIGLPKSEQPCLDAADTPVPAVAGACTDPLRTNPAFHEPRTNTGVGDFPGGDVMVTLGAFTDADGKPVGAPYMQAATLMHELGHNFERRHGGDAFEPNCKPTYLSVMNYLYQLRGLLDDGGKPHLDFSRGDFALQPLGELSLADGSLNALPYRIGYYAPLAGSYLNGLGTPAKKHCDGSDLLPTDAEMVRIDARTGADFIDWNADGDLGDTGPLDVNFNGRDTDVLADSDDWSKIRLNQIGGRRNTGALFEVGSSGRLAVGPLSLDSGRGDLGRGDLGRGDLGRGDLGRGDLGRGDLGRGDLGRGDLGRGDLGNPALGRGDLGRGDLGGGDLFVGDPGSPGGELDFETAGDLARTPPTEFAACVIGEDCRAQASLLHQVRLEWKSPNVGGVSGYLLYRAPGETVTAGNWELVGQLPSAEFEVECPLQTDPAVRCYSLTDGSPLLNGARYTYFAIARYADGINSDPSNLVTITGGEPAAGGR